MLNAHSPACPGCGALITRVVATNLNVEGTHFVRRRHCQFCNARFYTGQPVEQIAEVKWSSSGSQRTVRITQLFDNTFRKS